MEKIYGFARCSLAEEKGFTIFSYYCWGIALFTFILSLMA